MTAHLPVLRRLRRVHMKGNSGAAATGPAEHPTPDH